MPSSFFGSTTPCYILIIIYSSRWKKAKISYCIHRLKEISIVQEDENDTQ